jgi:hypothetical protein
MRTAKIVYTILGIFLLVIAFFITGVLAPEEYTGEIRGSFPDTHTDVWRNLTSLETIKGRKPDVESVTVVEESRDNVIWIENLKNGKTRTLSVVERDIPTYFVIERIQSDNGFTGRWEYYLSQNNETKRTEILIKESSVNTNLTLRAWHTIWGRSINLRRELKSLRVSLFQRLLTTQ